MQANSQKHKALDTSTGGIVIAGGSGVTPVMSNLRTLAGRIDRRPILFFYANRSWENVIFREE